MSAGKTERSPRPTTPVAESAPLRPRRAVRPVDVESFDNDERPARRQARPKKPFRKLKFIIFLAAAAWLFVAGVLVGRGTSPVFFDVDQLRNQLVTASAPISERIFHTGDEGVDFYDTLGQSGVDTQITDPRNYRPEYAQAPTDDSVVTDPALGDAGAGDPAQIAALSDDPLLEENAYGGKILEPQVKPKTEFPAYVALKASGARVETAASSATQPQQTVQQQNPAVQESQTLAPTQNKPQNRPQTQAATMGNGQLQTVTANAGQGSFAVQVAAVRGEDEARALLNNLDQKGFKGWIEKTTVGEGVWYRVRVGPYANRTVAEDYLQRLTKIGIKSPMIVSN